MYLTGDLGRTFRAWEDEEADRVERADMLRELERGHGLPPRPPPHEPELAPHDLLVERGPGVWVQVRAGHPIPHRLAGRPRRPLHPGDVTEGPLR